MLRPRRLIVTALLLLAVAGCRSTATHYRASVRLRQSPKLSVRPHSRDLREGARAAVVAFNTVVYSDRRPRLRRESDFTAGNERVVRITAEELRRLSDAMLVGFMDQMRQVPGLTLLPLAEVGANRLYQRLNYPRGEVIKGFSLIADNGRRVAPPGLKYMPVPHSVAEERKGMFFVGTMFANYTRRFQDDMNALTESLGVDFVILASTRVRLTARFADGWGGELELMEVVIVGRGSAKKYVYARHAPGPFAEDGGAVPATTLDADLLRLVNVHGRELAPTPGFETLRYWRTMANPYARVAAEFRASLERIRD